ncbi:hypothetical protein [Streptomyces sp. NPDC006463]|uniref:hypothetical protein n=1 Tax=Streptomyces sp. NPDC006463 TaxID=3364746 RepID=UPI0036A76B0E
MPRSAGAPAEFIAADPEFRQLVLGDQQAQGAAFGALLTEAVGTGEFRLATDTAVLTATLQATLTGAARRWAVDREGLLVDRRRSVSAALARDGRKDFP